MEEDTVSSEQEEAVLKAYQEGFKAGYNEARADYEQKEISHNVFEPLSKEELEEERGMSEEDWSKQFDRLHEDKEGHPKLPGTF